MRLLPSLAHARPEALTRLRDVLRRNLRVLADTHPGRNANRGVDASLVVHLLRDMQVIDPRATEDVAKRYEACRSAGAPPFRVVVDRGLVQEGWGRTRWSWKLRATCQAANGALASTLSALIQAAPERRIVLSTASYARLLSSSDPHLRSVASAEGSALTDALANLGRRVLAPGWVSAEIWRSSKGRPDRLRWWWERQELLDSHEVGPDSHWTRDELESFVAEVLAVLRTDGGRGSWRRARRHARQQWALERRELDASAVHQPELPDELDERRAALAHQDTFNDAFDRHDWVIGLVWRAMQALRCGAFYGAPNPALRELVELSIDRPAVWMAVEWQLQNNPEHLADLLLCSSSAAFALDRISSWHGQEPLAYDREQVEAGATARRQDAFRHAAEFAMDTLVSAGPNCAPSLAWLLKRLYERDGLDWQQRLLTTRFERDTIWSALADEATRRRSAVVDLLNATLAYASQRLADEGFGSRWSQVLAEALRAAAQMTDARARRTSATVALPAYLRMLEDGEQFEPRALSAENAAAMLSAIGPLRRTLRRSAAFARAAGQLQGTYTEVRRLKTKVRTHVRFLSRGIAGADPGVTPDLVDLLEDALRHATRDDFAKGHVCAFDVNEDVSFAMGGGPLAEDVTTAMARLPENKQVALTEVLAQVEEPAALAILTRSLRGRTRTRVALAAAAAVSTPPPVASLREVQARIELLASAELFSEAEKLLEEEAEVQTLGPVAGRAFWRFRMRLWIDLGQKRFDRVVATSLPAELDSHERPDAQRTLDFYQALAEFQSPSGSLDRAETLLEGLVAGRGDVSAYVVDLHAVRVRRLLGNDPFAPLSADQRAQVAALLTADDEMIRPFRDALRADLDGTYEGNRTLLRLALGQYDDVVDDLDAVNELLKSSDRLWAYRLEALIRLGRTPEARAGLDAAQAHFGDTEHLRSVEERLESKEVQLRVELDTVEHSAARVRLALGELRLLPLAMQAKACERELLDLFVLRHMRRACAELMDFVVFLKGGGAEPHEESINALFRHNLGLRTAHLGWSCHGEDPGGHTSGKRWGSRDLVPRKGRDAFHCRRGPPRARNECIGVGRGPQTLREAVRLHGDVQPPLPRSVVVRRRCRRAGAEDDGPRARGMSP